MQKLLQLAFKPLQLPWFKLASDCACMMCNLLPDAIGIILVIEVMFVLSQIWPDFKYQYGPDGIWQQVIHHTGTFT